MIILFLVFAVTGLLIYKYFVWNFNFWQKLGVPGPKPKPLYGNFPSTIKQHRNLAYEIHDVFTEFRTQGHPFVGVYTVRTPQLLVLSPELIKDVFVRKFNSFHDNEFGELVDKETDPLFGRNPFMLRGNEWKEKRAEIIPAFSPARMKAIYPLIEDVSKRMTEYIKDEIEKESSDGLEAKELSAKFTTDVVSSCIFAVDANSFKNEEAEIRKKGKEIMAFTPFTIVYFMLIGIFPFIKKIYKISLISKSVEKFFVKLMNDAINYRKENNVNRDDYLEHLLHLKETKGISELDMAAHAITFFVDGFETSSIVLSQCLLELSQNKDIQDKLRKEIKENLEDGKLSYEKLNELQYLDQIFNETLRLHPPVLMLSKICTEDVTLEGLKDHKVEIKKGMTALVPVYSIHHDPENFSDPERFDPERFSPENGGVRAAEDRGTFLGFGGGPRICLGRRFGTTQIKHAITEIINNFELTLNSKTKVPIVFEHQEFLLRVQGGIWIDYKQIK